MKIKTFSPGWKCPTKVGTATEVRGGKFNGGVQDKFFFYTESSGGLQGIAWEMVEADRIVVFKLL